MVREILRITLNPTAAVVDGVTCGATKKKIKLAFTGLSRDTGKDYSLFIPMHTYHSIDSRKRFSLIVVSAALAALTFIQCATPTPVVQAYKGWPSREGKIDIRRGFAHPPKGYGNVPFYWWTGDSLKQERLTEQLALMADASTDGFNISYNHTHSDVDSVLNSVGHGWCGRVQGGAPRIFSDEWWRIWNTFSAQCARHGIGVGMDDYVVGWKQNGEYIDTILALPEIAGHLGRIHMKTVGPDEELPPNVVSVVPVEESSNRYVVFASPAPELTPTFGQRMVEYYLDAFIRHMDDEGRKGMNYFFQDELNYDLDIHSWTPDMPEEFLRRKGYDILPLLPALFTDIGEETAKVRLDYAEVVTRLAGERYFKPIYDWSADRGLIYGSDNMGRGLNPLCYLDYFSVEQWFTAPGNDAPARGSSFRQTKVSSSVAHLYQRPRTWLEAFHSMGWDANGALLTYQLDHHIIAGGNLLCMHGMYYSTHGGWWEWAPPSFHFRMPYWPHMKVWLKYAERLCFVLSQGVHVVDVAILYPTETMQAIPGASAEPTLSLTDWLSPKGCDFDFIDFASLQRADIVDGELCVSDERYKVLVLADTRALHEETLAKILAYADSGGTVIGVGDLMPELAACSRIVRVTDGSQLLPEIERVLIRDFRSSSGEGRVLHRRVADQDVYMVMDVPKGDELFFRTHGKVELWDAQRGTIREIEALRTDEQGTWVRHEAEKHVSQLYVFSPGVPRLAAAAEQPIEKEKRSLPVEGEWELTVIPTMDNKWGDFRLPATPTFIGVEAREMECSFLPGSEAPMGEALTPISSGTPYVYGYGMHMKTRNYDRSLPIDKVLAEALREEMQEWDDYAFSWQYGVFDSPGGQGYHGLKAKVDPRFLILDQGAHQLFRTRVYAPVEGDYRMRREGVKPYAVFVDGEKVTSERVSLVEGWHELLIAYADTEKRDYSLAGMRGGSVDYRQRSMVVFYPMSAPEPQMVGEYEPIVASKWYLTDHLAYDCRGGEEGRWLYRFRTAPGTTSMHFRTSGVVEAVYVDGTQVADGLGEEGVVVLSDVNPGISEVLVVGMPAVGEPGAAFFKEPVALTCEGGKAETGDWTAWGAMKFFSGGVRYTKEVDLAIRKGQHVVLDLGEVDATCEVTVNGKFVDVLINKPCVLDISKQVKPGRNKLEVLVYSTLANHYQTIPSPYKGTAHAGLIGPVKIEITDDARMIE